MNEKSPTIEKSQLFTTTRAVFEEAVIPVLGASGYEVVQFHLTQKVGRDPFEALLEDPRIFYQEFEKIFSVSTDIILKWVGKYLAEKYMVDCSPEEFLRMIRNGDLSSKEKMIDIMITVYETRKK